MRDNLCYLSRNYRGIDSAGNKAKTDIECMMQRIGYHNVGLPQAYYSNVIVAFFYTLFSVLKGCFCLRKGNILVLQYPLKKYYAFICNVAHWRGCKVVTLIHDLGSFRRKKLTEKQEITRLDHSDYVIVHSEAMRKWLEQRGICAKLGVLEIFDYLTNKTIERTDSFVCEHPCRILFAGGLDTKHNGFLYEMAQEGRPYKLVLYGNHLEKEKLRGEVDYKGFVSSDELIATAQGDYGVVWYGPSLEGGIGNFGEYIQYNAPHKISLYIRCGLPVIIWKKAALAPFIEDNGLGIALSSLEELDTLLPRITEEEYQKMKCNVQFMSKKLSEGYFCVKALNAAVDSLKGI